MLVLALAACFNRPMQSQEFYQKMGLTPPKLSPLERRRRRLMFRNERSLYHSKCSATGKPMLSIIAPAKGLTVYEFSYWHSDAWSALEYGREIDFTRPFFPQWKALFDAVPRMNLVNDSACENSNFVNQCGRAKNCYMIFRTNYCQDCMYSHAMDHVKESLDCEQVGGSELCYEIVNCQNCYHSQYLEDCDNVRDSAFLVDCRSCSNCFGCFGLRHGEYQIFNTPYTKEEYEKRVAEFRIDSYEGRERFRAQFETWLGERRETIDHNKNAENSTGSYLENTRDCQMCEFCMNTENLQYCSTVYAARDCMDFDIWGENSELVYECITVGDNAHTVGFCVDSQSIHDVWYSSTCFRGKHLFGCVGLKDQEYCILNKKYTPEQYAEVVRRLREHMIQTGEWGEFFPASYSHFGYNESLAHQVFPLTKDEAAARGLPWYEEPMARPPEQGYVLADTVEAYRDPAKAQELLQAILLCEKTGKAYKITPQELAFYLKMHIPVPRLAPNTRFDLRRTKMRPMQYS